MNDIEFCKNCERFVKIEGIYYCAPESEKLGYEHKYIDSKPGVNCPFNEE